MLSMHRFLTQLLIVPIDIFLISFINEIYILENPLTGKYNLAKNMDPFVCKLEYKTREGIKLGTFSTTIYKYIIYTLYDVLVRI